MHRRQILLSLAIGIVAGFLFIWKAIMFISIAGIIIFGIMCSRADNSVDGLSGLPSQRMLVFFQYILGGLVPFLKEWF